ncbi:PREDICTED: uncharacterized protein LOC109587834 [Amphimedon queenslandica]|uniref:Death domain-containing protein n=2 Tax=Amphimedon queenslandica TaxID=400682 RepID=A0AAN0JRX0_AMPQE|nr:PREDICTED: uncharacterized protein LOC109587834 [Amphimedon queenslandica]|eukprot:XP_019859616.1 PREDICTED: uncharacterized protein LOC109587834 [Amphimedon queenslandica]
MYPALVVSLLKEGFKMLEGQIPYRNAIKLQSTDLGVNILLVDTIQWLEIHCDGPAGPVQDACPKLRLLVHGSIQSVSSKFSYSSNTLEGTLCQTCGAGVCRRNKAGTSITCTNGGCSKAREIGPRQSCWFKNTAPMPSSVFPIDSILPEASVLNESHAPVILKAINKIVNEWENLGIFLGLENEELKLIHSKSFYQIDVSRKDMIILWLKTGTATREKLIKALQELGRNDIAAEVKRLPKQ